MEIALGSVQVLIFILPLAILWVWVARIIKAGEGNYIRVLLGWSSLVLVTLSVILFWMFLLQSIPGGSPNFEVQLDRLSKPSMVMSAIAFLAAIVGSGRKRVIVAIASALVPISWVWVKILE